MIKVLKDWNEIGSATLALAKEGLPEHSDMRKNWDHFTLYDIIKSLDRNLNILDLGCGEGYTLRFLQALKFQNLNGIDLNVDFKLRLRQIYRMIKSHSMKPPFNLYKGNIERTNFSNNSFNLLTSISVIEHGVNIESFLSESYRLLLPGGLLFITTDYWEEKINVNNKTLPFGLDWKIFSKAEIESLVKLAKDIGFSLYNESSVFSCQDKPIYWNNSEYTFIAIVLEKVK